MACGSRRSGARAPRRRARGRSGGWDCRRKQIGDPGLGVSGAPAAEPIRMGPIDMGNRHSQHTSATGVHETTRAGLRRSLPAPEDEGEENDWNIVNAALHGRSPSLSGSSSRGTSVIRKYGPSASSNEGVARRPKRLASRPPWSKKNARPCALINSSGRPASNTMTEGFSRAIAHSTSTGRVPSMKQEIAGQGVFFKGIDPRSPGRDQPPVGCPDVALDDDRRVETGGS